MFYYNLRFMEEKKEKKGFWASLFSPKPCSCSCGNSIVEELEEANQLSPENTSEDESKTKKESDKDNESSCECC